MTRVLVVEDEKPISDLIQMSLTAAGFLCHCAYDGLNALNMLEENKYDLILLDILLPEADGYQVLEYLKPLGIPVIFVTAKATLDEKVKGLKLGADDYLTKPFEIIELLARVEVVLRRFNLGQSILEVGGLCIDTGSRTVKRGGREIPLTKKEYDLLIFFVTNKNIALFRERIYERIWEDDFMGDSRTVDLHVQRLRRKLDWEDLIKAVYKVGYRLEIGQ